MATSDPRTSPYSIKCPTSPRPKCGFISWGREAAKNQATRASKLRLLVHKVLCVIVHRMYARPPTLHKLAFFLFYRRTRRRSTDVRRWGLSSCSIYPHTHTLYAASTEKRKNHACPQNTLNAERTSVRTKITMRICWLGLRRRRRAHCAGCRRLW